MCPLDVQLWIQARFVQEGWREGHQELLTKLRTQRLCRYALNMRVSCVGGCVDESAYLAARGRAAGNRGTTHCDKVGAAALHRKELLTKLRSQRLCRYTVNMRVSCVGGCVDESAYLAARGGGRWKPWRHPLRQSCNGVQFVGGIAGAAGAVISALTL